MSTYDLNLLDPAAFEQLVNSLMVRVLGPGHTTFGPGSDGGRDGYFEGEAPYPSLTDRWKGTWYIQSKFHAPNLSKNPQKWLVHQVKEELAAFSRTDSRRTWPGIWILATNIEPSGTPQTGAFDVARREVEQVRPELAKRFHIWGGRKILEFLSQHPDVAKYYKHVLTPGHILAELQDALLASKAEVSTILRHLVVTQFADQQYTKLEQAGSASDTRPGIHRLFVDIPFRAPECKVAGFVFENLVRSSARPHSHVRVDSVPSKQWLAWQRRPSQAPVWFIRGGPGQGKSTIGQYFCQIQRAALILQDGGPNVSSQVRSVATDVKRSALKAGFWTSAPRIPISIELREYAQWFGKQNADSPRGLLTYLSSRIAASVEQEVLVGTLKKVLSSKRWVVVLDGLDEVPHDVKDAVAHEVNLFVDTVIYECGGDLLAICTSRPQGYSGQFGDLDAVTIELTELTPDQALSCAQPILTLDRSEQESTNALEILRNAVGSGSVRELMTTPLQAHIMAIVVRDGGRPPDRRWQLYSNFYEVIRRREANRNLPDKRLAKLLREDELLLKTVHNRLGFVLHARAETSEGAQTKLDRQEFREIVSNAVTQTQETAIEDTVITLVEATTERLVLVSTPDDGNHVRFDIRQLQEFFAAEFLKESVPAEIIRERLELIAGDSHWREVVHFLLSALIENDRGTELALAIQVLEELDTGEAFEASLIINRRMCRGASIAIRLLHEGVLEQDRRLRLQFAKCIEPIVGATSKGMLTPLISLQQPNSRAWVSQFLWRLITERAPAESIGASIILLQTLRDDDRELTQNFTHFLLAATSEYASYAIASFPRPRPQSEVKAWLVELALRILSRDSWVLLSEDGVRSCIAILREHPRTTFAVARKMELPELDQFLLTFLIGARVPNPEPSFASIGFLRVRNLTVDWTSRLPESEMEKHGENPASGVLRFVALLRKFAQRPSAVTLRAALQCLGSRAAPFLGLPVHLRAFLPYSFGMNVPAHIAELEKANEDDINGMIAQGRFRENPIHRLWEEADIAPIRSDVEVLETLRGFPGIAIRVFDLEMGQLRGVKGHAWIRRTISMIVDHIVANPEALVHSPLLWGTLLTWAPDRSDELRCAMRGTLTHAWVDESSWLRDLHPFLLELPEEMGILPTIANVMADFLLGTRSEEDYGTMAWHRHAETFTQLLKGYFPNFALLGTLLEGNSVPTKIRLAGLFIREVDSRNSHSEYAVIAKEFENHIQLGDQWATKLYAAYLMTVPNEARDSVLATTSRVLDAIRNDFTGRGFLDPILLRWREQSEAPVLSSSAHLKWLSSVVQ